MPDTADPATEEPKKKPDPPRDPFRELVETVVFVVVLVLLLKLFVTEAFVIPTGSMAETLYGYQRLITCPKCGHEFPVNCHDEVEGKPEPTPLYGYCCPNCRHVGRVQDLTGYPRAPNSGDRVLVLKPLYNLRQPHRGDVVVFKFPEKPQLQYVAQNYIKRAMAFGGETVAVYRGDLLTTTSVAYPEDDPDLPRPRDPNDLWRAEYMYPNNARAAELFNVSRAAGFPGGTGGFEVVRKGEEQLLADLRVVWDNDKQSEDYVALARRAAAPDDKGRERVWWPRWYAPAGAEGAWTTNDPARPVVFGHDAAEQHWVRYRHLAWKSVGDRRNPADRELQPWTWGDHVTPPEPGPVDNFLGYNAGRDAKGKERGEHLRQEWLWVGDLVLECEAELGGGAEVTLELSKGVDRFRAAFANGQVTVSRVTAAPKKGGEDAVEVLGSRPCKVTDGRYRLRFGNVDCRLWVWVDGRRIDFGAAGDYNPPTPEQEAEYGKDDPARRVTPEGWTQFNDVDAPAGIGAKGKVTVRGIKLSRDVYYTRSLNGDHTRADHTRPDLYYVQPGHYFCLGDNSASSLDSRSWGVVPERLMLGKAVFVFFPLNRVGFIR